MDPFGGVPSESLTLQRYLYTAENPLNRADPTGLDPDIGGLGIVT